MERVQLELGAGDFSAESYPPQSPHPRRARNSRGALAEVPSLLPPDRRPLFEAGEGRSRRVGFPEYHGCQGGGRGRGISSPSCGFGLPPSPVPPKPACGSWVCPFSGSTWHKDLFAFGLPSATNPKRVPYKMTLTKCPPNSSFQPAIYCWVPPCPPFFLQNGVEIDGSVPAYFPARPLFGLHPCRARALVSGLPAAGRGQPCSSAVPPAPRGRVRGFLLDHQLLLLSMNSTPKTSNSD